ncbi:hypothetical protein DNTS_017274 [Danionella cerebrum]|uniref:Uncharacterized protein n=1 Tax=Danionella cerebrum TaxID=2873325 RepID=A0A553PJ49_9TELE|nr:hypothetical protein DNTS_017274 [Danionella translucida]
MTDGCEFARQSSREFTDDVCPSPRDFSFIRWGNLGFAHPEELEEAPSGHEPVRSSGGFLQRGLRFECRREEVVRVYAAVRGCPTAQYNSSGGEDEARRLLRERGREETNMATKSGLRENSKNRRKFTKTITTVPPDDQADLGSRRLVTQKDTAPQHEVKKTKTALVFSGQSSVESTA